MTPYEFVGWTLNNTSSVTAITSTRITHGLRPRSTTTPCINYYETDGDRYAGIERQGYSVNCRADTPAGARDLARVVTTVFDGTHGQGVYGTNNSFSVGRAYLKTDVGLIPEEPDENNRVIYNAPLEIEIQYAVTTVS